MNTLRTLAAGIAVAAFTILPAASHASNSVTTFHLTSDSELDDVFPDSRNAFVAEGRIGDRSGSTAFEAGLGETAASAAASGHHDWQRGVREPFTIAFSKDRNLVVFALGNNTLTFAPKKGAEMVDIAIRAQALDAKASVGVADLIIGSRGIPDSSMAYGANGLDILLIRGASLQDGFLMTGFATLSWQGTAPTQSKLAFQIKVGEASASAPTANEATSWGKIKAKNK
ncbi:MAG: choice-of-anchor W domain-containing protein [bacterium]